MMKTQSFRPLTPAMIESLRRLKAKTGWGVVSLFGRKLKSHKLTEERRPSPSIINSWLFGTVKSADPQAFTLVIEAYKSIPKDQWHESASLDEQELRSLYREIFNLAAAATRESLECQNALGSLGNIKRELNSRRFDYWPKTS